MDFEVAVQINHLQLPSLNLPAKDTLSFSSFSIIPFPITFDSVILQKLMVCSDWVVHLVMHAHNQHFLQFSNETLRFQNPQLHTRADLDQLS